MMLQKTSLCLANINCLRKLILVCGFSNFELKVSACDFCLNSDCDAGCMRVPSPAWSNCVPWPLTSLSCGNVFRLRSPLNQDVLANLQSLYHPNSRWAGRRVYLIGLYICTFLIFLYKIRKFFSSEQPRTVLSSQSLHL